MNTLLGTPTFIAAVVTLLTALATLTLAYANRLTTKDTNEKVTITHDRVAAQTSTNTVARAIANGKAAAIQSKIDEIEGAINEMRALGITPLTVAPPASPPPEEPPAA
jgi:hypothetical protein